MYAAAFLLAALANQGSVTWWRQWTDPVPTPVAFTGPRAKIEAIMWRAFGFDAPSVLRAGSAPLAALSNPTRVMIDPFFSAQNPDRVTVVKPTQAGVSRAGNSIKVDLNDGAWVWNAAGPTATAFSAVEYNPVNTFNQQNGVRCALPASTAVGAPSGPAAAYHTDRLSCPHYGGANTCQVNGEHCASDGAGGTRIPKPRVLVPSAPGCDDSLLTPTAFDEMISRSRVDKATGHAQPLPKAQDLALLTAWAQRGSGAALDFGPLVLLLGPALLPLLTEP